jgi:hypothetical protein
VIKVFTSSKAWQQKEYVIHFLNEHYLSSPMNLEKDENVDGWIFIDSELPKSEWSISAQFFHDLDDHWLSHKFAPITLRNGLAHPSTPDLVDDLGTIFFLLSHYSECLQPEKDVHNRVSAMHSLVVEKNWQNRCVVNECAERFLKQLSLHFSNVKWEMPQVSYRITHDVDRPLKYAFEKPSIHLKRGLGSYRFGNSLKNIIKEIGRISLYPILKDKVDPFNHFKWILRENNNFGSTPLFYWIPIQAHAEFDSLYQLNDKKIQIIFDQLISAHALIGCHPNYNSSETLEGINNNWEEFQKSYSNNEIKRNRQHFLKFDPLNFPEQLQLAQVNEDSSYGWADRTGFRASCSLPYFLFDVKNKRTTKIKEIPLCVMDVTVITSRYMNITEPEKVLNQFSQYLDLVKSHGGIYCVLWHNDTLQFSPYKNVYWKVIKLASNAGICA